MRQKANPTTKKEIRLTYEEWNRLGYGIIKGSKSSAINEDFIPIFNEGQVSRMNKISGSFIDDCWASIGEIF